MPFLSSEEVENRVSSPDNLANRLSRLTILPMPSTGNRGINIPIEIQRTIALLGSDPEREEDQQVIADAFGVPQSVVSKYSHGRTHNTIDSVKPGIKEVVDLNKGKREDAETKAIDTLLMTLDLIPEKLSGETKLKKLTATAKDLATIAEKMGKRGPGELGGNQVNLNIYVPRMKAIEEYDVIDV